MKVLLAAFGLVALAQGAEAQPTTPAPAAPRIDNTTALQKLSSTAYSRVTRSGFYLSGDAPAVDFVSSMARCALNSGAGDGGSQVRSADGKCWLADFPTAGDDVREFGAKCDGATDDAGVLNAALAAAGRTGAVVLLPAGRSCGFRATINVPANVTLMAFGHNSGDPARAWPRFAGNLVQLAQNIDGVSLNGSFAKLESLSINCGFAQPQSAGNCVNVGAALREDMIDDVAIIQPFVGIGTTTAVLLTIQNSFIYSPTPTTGVGIKIDGGNDQIVLNTFCQGTSATAQPRACLEVRASGSVYMWRFSSLFGGIGKLYDPEAGQTVSWVWDFGGTYDSGQVGIEFAPTSTGAIEGDREIDTWSSTNAQQGVLTLASPSAKMDDIVFTGHRAYNNGHEGALFDEGIANLRIDGGSFCGNSTASAGTYAGISFGGDTHVEISNVRSGPCASQTNPQSWGVQGTSSSANYVKVIGNDLQGNGKGPASLNLPSVAAADYEINGNIGIDDVTPTIASASTINAPPNPVFFLTGATAIATINGFWQGRLATVISGSATPFATGGNIGAACTMTPGVPATLTGAGGQIWPHC